MEVTISHLIKELIDNVLMIKNININLIDNKDNPLCYIIIKDDGSGMILDDLKSDWILLINMSTTKAMVNME